MPDSLKSDRIGHWPDSLDPDIVTAWLGAVAESPTVGALSAHRVGNGQSNLTYRVVDERRTVAVLRRPPMGRAPGSAHDVEREARIVGALRHSAVPVPSILGVHPRAGTDEMPVVAMSFSTGTALDPTTADALPASTRYRIGPEIARTLAAVHAVDVELVGLGDLARRTGYAERQLRRWSTQWDQYRTRELPAMHTLIERLRREMPPAQGQTLVHGDLHPDNVLVEPESGEITAVLDWELATVGDPLADLGTLLAYWPEPGEDSPLPFAVSTRPGFARRDELEAAYADASGRDTTAVGYWHALGLWKIAVICEGIVHRVAADPRNRAQRWTPSADTVEHFVDLAHAAVRRWCRDQSDGTTVTRSPGSRGTRNTT